MFLMMSAHCAFADEEGGKNGENVCLQRCHQQFKKIDENSEGNRKDRDTQTGSNIHRSKNEYQRQERKDDQVTRQHICKKPDHQRHW